MDKDEDNNALRDEQLARRRLNRLMDALPVFSGFCSPDGHLLQTRPETPKTFLWALPAFAYSPESIAQIVALCERAGRGQHVQVERPYRRGTLDPNDTAIPEDGHEPVDLARGLLTLSPVSDEDGYVDELAITLIDCDESGLAPHDQRARGRLTQTNMRVDAMLALAQSVVEALDEETANRPLADGRDALGQRLDTLGSVIEVMSDPDARSLPLDQLIAIGLKNVSAALRQSRLQTSGRDASLPLALVPMLTLVIAELADNAERHGAWREDSSGRVDLQWDVLDSAQGRSLRLHWLESDAHPIPPIGPAGFGSAVYDRLLPEFAKGRIHRLEREDGLSWTVEVPLKRQSAATGATDMQTGWADALDDDVDDEASGGFDGGFDGGLDDQEGMP